MFQFTGLAPRIARCQFALTGCPIRKSVLRRVFAPGHGLSQLVTSFFASESQGILHVPFSPFLFSWELRLFSPLPSVFSDGRVLRLRRHRTSLLPPYGGGARSVCLDSLICSFSGNPSYGFLRFQYVNVLLFQVVPGRVELPTSTLSV